MNALRSGSLAVLAAGSLAGCGGEAPASGAAGQAPPRPAAAPVRDDPARDMVAAVPAGRPGGPVELRFAIAGRPEVGKPFDLDVLVMPTSPAGEIRVTFRGGDGLAIESGHEMPPVERPQVGAGIAHRLRVVPRADGIYSLTAVALVQQTSGESLARTFSIPVIAGTGLAEGASGAP